MKAGKGYTCYTVKNRGEILTALREQNLVKFPDIILHHVTWEFGVTQDGSIPDVTEARIVGIKSNDKIQALVVNVNGSMIRPDGKTLHITLSLDKAAGAKPVHSNDLLSGSVGNLTKLDIPLELEPTFIPF